MRHQTIPGLECNQLLDTESLATPELDPGDRGRVKHLGDDADVTVHSGRGPHGSRCRSPHTGAQRGRPQDPAGGLKLEPGEVVVLEPGSEAYRYPVGKENDLVLHKRGDQIDGTFGRFEPGSKGPGRLVTDQPVAGPPDQILSVAYGEVVLEVDIEGGD